MKKPRLSGLSHFCRILALALFASGAAWSARAQVTIIRAREELPRLKPVGVSYTVGERIMIEVTLDATITSVVGTPRLQLDHLRTGLTAAEQQLRSYAVYQEFAGFRMYFVYVVQPGDFALDLNAVVFDRNGAVITTSNGQFSRTDAATLPITGVNSLVGSSDIAIRTIGFRGQPDPLAMALTVQETQTGIIPVTRVETGSLAVNFQVTAVPGAAIGGNFTLATLPFAIPANAIPADLNLTGVAATGAPVTLRLHPTDYGTETAGDLLVTVNITAGPAPTFFIDGIAGGLIEGDPTVATANIILSRAPTTALSITLANNNPTALQIVGSTVISFPIGTTVRTYQVRALDGGTLVSFGSTATISGTSSDPNYVSAGSAVFALLNVDPILLSPSGTPNPWEPTPGGEGFPYTFSWSGTDVPADIADLQAQVAFGDGNVSPWINGANGFVNHVYNTPNTYTVTITLRDQDGGYASVSGELEILPAVPVQINEYKYPFNTPADPGNDYFGLQGLGRGTIDDLDALTTRLLLQGTVDYYNWLIKYGPTQAAVSMLATPEPVTIVMDVDGAPVTNVYDSFFHVWLGDGFYIASVLEPLLAPSTALLALGGEPRQIGGVFSREFYVEDNYADIDHDELPDRWERMWDADPASRDFELPNRMDNPDADFLPRGAGATLIYPAQGFQYLADGTAFGHVFEIRGFDPGLNAANSDPSGQPDEPGAPLVTAGWPGTSPTSPDTDGDGRDDGWEYYFWRNATVTNVPGRPITGEAYDPTRVIEGIIIPSATIAAAFNPLVPGTDDDDTDDDGLSDVEEFVLGTNPVDWDTDGDAMNDGFEVMNGLNPFSPNDAPANPDGDWMARDGALRHWQVYTANNFDPRVAWGRNYLERNRALSMITPTTAAYSNYEEHYLGRVSIESGFTAAVPPFGSVWMTNPSAAGTLGGLAGTTVLGNGADSDGDQMPDGWELYVSCGPNALPVIWPIGPGSALDAAFDDDGDNLTVRAEFHASESCAVYGFTNQNLRWWNKFWTTDPWNADTDGDAVIDGDEGATFQYDNGYAGYIRGSRPGGMLNPCCVDTDMDFIPDGFEFQYLGTVSATGVADGMDGTYFDSKSGPDAITGANRNFDYDADGLENYQEYWMNAVFHFQYDKWVSGLGYGAYDPMQIFTGVPYEWDWATWANYWQEGEVLPSVPFYFIQAEFRPFSPYGPVCYASTDPRMADTDEDGMDDYFEMFHGLNPLLSQIWDLVGKGLPTPIYDFRLQPWLAGMQNADPDQDGIFNYEEMLMPNRPEPANHHTDPSPLWVTDTSYANSWVNLYYNLGTVPMYWTTSDPFPVWLFMPPNPGMDARPDFMFSFEVNEGYDTDNDNIQDKQEIIGSTVPGVTDPLDMDAPIMRKALYLNGNAAARTRIGFAYGRDALRSWTIEAWIKPRQFATGARQIILERPVFVNESDTMPTDGYVRRTFRLGIEWNGAPFVEYDNAGKVVLTERAEAINWPITTTNWTHLAATMSGVDKKLTLYIDGQIVQTALTASIPCTGFIDGTTYLYRSAPLVIGAADANPQGAVNGGNTFINGAISDGPSQPSLSDFFTGWIDEVRIWDGARSPVDIASDYNNRKRYSRDDVVKSLEKSVSVLGTMLASRNYNFLPTGYSFDSYFTNATFRLMQTGGENLTYRLPPTLLCHYAFDNLPDPKNEPIIPNSFDRLNGRPTVDYPGVPWWAQAADRSTVYRTYDANPYLFVHWIENTVATLPLGHLNSNGLFVADSALDSVYWKRFATGAQVLPEGLMNVFNNSANPYGLSYKHGDSTLSQVRTESFSERFDPTMDSQYNHLLPLRGAVADMDVPLWDNGTPGTALFDSDGDGMPDIWEIVNGLNPFDASDGVLDPDDDGVDNYNEFITGGNPLSMYSFDPIIDDGAYDADGDGISTLDEITIWNTNPGNPDTDDDGISDGDEVDPTIVKPDGRRITSPVDSSSPAIPRSLVLDGIGREIPDSGSEKDATGASSRWIRNRLSLENFSVEAWVLLNRENQNGTAVCRKTDAGGTTFAIGFVNNIPYAEFVAAGGAVKRLTATERLETNVWVHLMATMDTASHAFSFYIDGLPYSTIDTFHVPAQGDGQTTVGAGLYGLLDNVRIWDFAIDKDQVAANFNHFRASITFSMGGTVYTPPELSEVSIQSTAFATNVIRFSRGATPEGISYTNANMALGMPDHNFFSLGEGTLREDIYYWGSTRTNYQFDGSSGGWVQFNMGTQPDFRANGDDRQELFVFERLSQKEPVAVLVSVDGDAWYYAGTTEGGVSGIDLDQALLSPVYYNETTDLYSFSIDAEDRNTDEDVRQATFRYVWLVGYSSELFSDWRRDWWNNNNWYYLNWYYWDFYYGWWDWTEDYATLALPGPEIDAVGIASYGIDKPAAWYPFDDGENTDILNLQPQWPNPKGNSAEDYRYTLDWDWALDASRGVAFSSNTPEKLYGVIDRDMDGMADWWERLHFGSTLQPARTLVMTNVTAIVTAFGESVVDSAPTGRNADTDGDGLDNLYEFWADTNPRAAISYAEGVDVGVSDAYRDPDGDGLVNILEQEHGTHPQLKDTDDDGLSDADEVANGTDPTDPRSPPTFSAIRLNGNANCEVVAPFDPDLTLMEFDVAVSVCPLVTPVGNAKAELLTHQFATNRINYRLTLDSQLQVTIEYTAAGTGQPVKLTSPAPLAINKWTDVRATFSRSDRRLSLLLNGSVVAYLQTATLPVTAGPGPLRTAMGSGLNGLLDYLVIRDAAPQSKKLLRLMYTFDDGTHPAGTSGNPDWHRGQVQNFALTDQQDWLNEWRNSGTLSGGAAIEGISPFTHLADADGDGLPDQWEHANNLDPDNADQDGNGILDGLDDFDGDGLSNYAEWRSDTDPWRADSDNDGMLDRDEDADDDGLSNLDEFALHGTDPGNPDTDDDGIADGEEVRNLSSPVYAGSPEHARSLNIQGTHYLVPEGDESANGRFDLNAWTVELWVNPRFANMDAVLVQRRIDTLPDGLQFSLELSQGMPLVRFTTVGGEVYTASAPVDLPVNAWTHLAGVWDPDRDTLELFINGISYMAQACLERPASGLGTTYLGDIDGALFAYVDDLRVWGVARGFDEIAGNFRSFADFMTLGNQAANYEGILFADGVQAFADQVTEFTVGANDGPTPNAHTDPAMALGAPDGNFVSLGVSDITVITNAAGMGYSYSIGHMTVQFTNNVVRRSWDSQPELVIFECADRQDSFRIWVSVDGDQWYNAGLAPGGTCLIDLDAYLSLYAGQETIDGFQYVKIVDSGMNPWTTLGMPGADIDAVGAIIHGARPVAWYPFDDGQNETLVNPLSGQVDGYGAQDFTYLRDWENDWTYAIRPSYLNLNQLVFSDNAAPVFGMLDSDADGLPDWWEQMFFGSSQGADAADDADRDGLSNLYEYMVGTNPKDSDTDNNGVPDAQEDADGDDVQNGVEFTQGTDPRLADTDDDSFSDGWEIAYGANPLESRSPAKARALALNGTTVSQVSAPDALRLELSDFDISAWVYPTGTPASAGELVAREVGAGVYNYRLYLDSQRRPVAQFTDGDETTQVALVAPDFRAVPLNAWTHLRMTFDAATGHLDLLVNDASVAFLNTASRPLRRSSGIIATRVGSGLAGFIDDVEIRSGAASVLDYTFDDGTSDLGTTVRGTHGTTGAGAWHFGQVEDFADAVVAVATNWQDRLLEAGSLKGSATIVALIDDEGELLPGDWVDTDGDGLPDEWEVDNGLNPLEADTDGDGVRDGDEDTDLDGLNALNEYLAGTDPNDPQTVNGTFDGDADSDGDGLSNIDEQNLGSDPGLPDTDDDGISDLIEVSADADGYTLPNASLSPARAGALRITAAGQYASLPLKPRFRLEESWTIEAWVNIASTFSGTGTVIKRGSGNVVNYELGFSASRPFIRMVGVYGSSVSERIVLADDALNRRNHWYHLAGVYDFAAGELHLYVDGVPVKWSLVGAEPGAFSASGLLPLRVGEGFRGMIDEVRIWAEAREAAAIGDNAYRTFEHASAGPLCELRFDDLGTTAEDFARPRADWTRNWASAATLTGATLVSATDSPVIAMAFVDEDADELPDFWELALFGDIFGGIGLGDPDGDGLNNTYEYRSRLHPLWASTWDDSTWDGNRDFDGDGLLNILEQDYSTMPDMSDTDDDGFTDYQEIYGTTVGNGPLGLSSPRSSFDPFIPKGLQLDGTGRMVVPAQGRHSLTEWTLAAWVRPSSVNNGGIVIARTFSDGAVNYELGVEQDGAVLRPYTRYTSFANGILKEHKTALSTAPGTVLTDGVSNHHLLVDRDAWTHLAAVYSITNHTLSLFVNGDRVALRTDAIELPATGSGAALPLAGELTVGGGALNTAGTAVTGGFEGAIDDVRIASLISSEADVRQMMGGQLVVDPTLIITNTSTRAVATLPVPRAGEFLVGLKPGASADAVVASVQALNIQVVRRYKIVSALHVRVAAGADAEAVRAELEQDPNVAYVEPNYNRRWSETLPNDPNFGELWGLHNTGQSGGTEDADIDAPEAWDVSTGNGQVVVAVIDTGIDYNHPDLVNNMWINPGETAGNGLDDDGNGFVDDVYGYNFAEDNSDPMDDYGHGTHVAGTIGAVGNNATSVAGINWGVKLMAIRAGNASGLYDADIVASIDYAVQMGARISNNSYGGYGNSQTIYDAISRARDADHLFVAAAGNDANDNDVNPMYPASYDLDNIIAVAASDRNDTLAYFSNFGATSVDLAAPGVAILSTVPGGGTAVYDGTSMASPHVAGVAALVLSVDDNLSYMALRSALLGNVDALEVLNGRCLTGGRLNVGNILPKVDGGTQLAVRSLTAWYRFDDGGTTVEDFTLAANWRRDWRQAGRLQYTASMGAAAAFLPFGDTDGDALPDWWEELVGLDPRDATGDNGSDTDPDGDGLVNLSEYLASLAHFARGERGLNPFLVDTDNDGLTDAQEDSDLDSVANIHEQNIYATDPGDADTDDDGTADGAELTAKTLPTDSSVPYVARALTFAGGSAAANVVTVPDKVDAAFTARHSAEEWTVEAWVKPGAMANGTYPVISRRTVASGRRNYEVGLSNGVPYVAFDGSENGAAIACRYSSALPANTWTHLAARFQLGGTFDQNHLSLFINGVQVSSTRTGWRPATGPGDLLFGSAGLVGQLLNVRVWSIPQSDDQIAGIMNNELLGGDVGEMSGYLSLSGAGHLKETATTTLPNGDGIDMLRQDWTLECWVRTTAAGGRIILRRNQGDRTDDDFNYYLGISPTGTLIGRFNMEYGVWTDPGGLVFVWVAGEDPVINNIVGEIPVNDGQWHHVAYVRDANFCYLYVDGMLDTKQDRIIPPVIPNIVPFPDNFWRVKAMGGPCTFGEDLVGSMDEVRIWNRNLPSDELQAMSAVNLAGNEPGLITYFNFDFQSGDTADERSYLRDSASEYGIYIPNAVRLGGASDGPPITYDPLRAVQGVALAGMFLCNDGGTYVEDRVWMIGLSPFDNEKYAGRMGSTATWAVQSPVLWFNGQDSDGDGLPDAWERDNGFDPFNVDSDGNGVGDCFDDPDHDGLSNGGEWRAATDPWNGDSDNDGISDYEDTSAGSARMNGVRFSDNDYVEDYWEDGFVQTYASPDRYDEHYDLDGDGWNNWSERRFAPSTRPDMTHSQASSNYVLRVEYPTPSLIVTLDYPGVRDLRVASPTLVVHAYTDANMNGMPDAVYRVPLTIPDIWPMTLTLTAADLQLGHLRQGLNWFYAFIDLDGSQRAIVDGSVTWLTWTAGEPAAVADGQIPGIDIGWDRNEVRFNLVDEARSFARLSWESFVTDSQSHTISIYHAVANTLVFTRSFTAPRTWLHEGDILAGKTQDFGLGWGVANGASAYRWTLDGINRGYITNTYAASTPVAVTDTRLDDIVQEARPEFSWRMSPEATEFEIEIRKGSAAGTVVYLARHLAPNRTESSINVNDLCVWRFPYQAGNVMPNGQTFSNDTYYWKVKAYSPAATTGGAWSDQPSFRLDVNTSVTGNGGYGWCTVNVRYPGLAALAGGAPIRVQAFRSRSFNGTADAEKQLSAAGSVTLAGLAPGLYYFRAYVDQNNNRQRDNWESYGYLRDVVNAIEPFRVVGADASTLGLSPTASITIRDADTDNDLIPDATEYIMWGASGGDWLSKAGPGPIVSSPGGTDFDGDGLNDASELDAGTSIFNIDSDGDGIPDLLDRNLLGFDPTAAERLRITGLDLANGSIGWRWEAAETGSGIVSLAEPGAEVFSVGQTLNYSVEFTESLANPDWQPVSTISSGVSGGQVALPQIRSASGFYRMRMLTE